MKQTKYFSASTQYGSMDAHKQAEAFLAEMQSQGFVGFQSPYGNYGFRVTYWQPKRELDEEYEQNTARDFNIPDGWGTP